MEEGSGFRFVFLGAVVVGVTVLFLWTATDMQERRFQEAINAAKAATGNPCYDLIYEYVTPPAGLNDGKKLILLGKEVNDDVVKQASQEPHLLTFSVV